ncbi:laminin subunit beta-1-like isoform X2 [Montipora foliosa]
MNDLHNLCQVSNVISLAASSSFTDQTPNCNMATWVTVLICLLFTVAHLVLLTEPSNVAFLKPVYATATCGSPSEQYFSISQRNEKPRDRNESTCNALDASNSHNASDLVDGKFLTWWQSPAAIDKVNITIDLHGRRGKFYYANKVVIQFGEYYRPGQLAFYKSKDYGRTYQRWHHFVSNAEECQEKFGVPNQNNPVRVDQVLCMTYPDEAVESNDVVTLIVVGPRGNVESPSDALLGWMNVTNVKLQFMSLRRIFDAIAVKWHHYAVREVEVDAYCLCNGQGNGRECFFNETLNEDVCKCQTGVCGIDCSICCPAYNQYPWKRGGKGPLVADPDAACKRCNCHGHSDVCVYNETVAQMKKSLNSSGHYSGGGVCQNCQDNTEGINCEKCKPFYFRPQSKSPGDKDACQHCNCSVEGTKNLTLQGVQYLDCFRNDTALHSHQGMEPGACYCKNNTMGRQCNECKPGYHNLSAENPEGCQECTCFQPGTVNGSNICEPDEHGICNCKKNVEGHRCSTCKNTYFGLSQEDLDGCKECSCDVGGALGNVCNKTTGQCKCKESITQRRCNSPQNGFYFPTLHFISSDFSEVITSSQQGNKTWVTTVNIVQGVNSSGIFMLLLSYTSTSSVRIMISVESVTAEVTLSNCSQLCFSNLSTFGEMSLTGSVVVNVTYRASATHFKPVKVVALPQEFYQPLLLGNSSGDFLANCSVLDNDIGKGTDHHEFCLAQVFSLTVNYLGRALSCNCNETGAENSTCLKYGGQCHCKPGVTGRMCDKCIAGFYNFSSQGCSACGCASDNKVCDADTGQCICPPNTIGRTCNQCSHKFWAWNETFGCQACNCSDIGATVSQCNLTTGECSCNPGVQGEKCMECMDGYKNLTRQGCSLCSCNDNGSLSEVCNKSSGQCPCKNNSAGLLCDLCKSGFFYLTDSNPKGCTNCVCMGITANCSSTTLYRKQKEVDLAFWSLALANGSQSSFEVSEVYMMDESIRVKMIAANISANDTVYWKAPANFTYESLVGGYGGNLSFKVYFGELYNGTLRMSNPKIVLKGVKNISIEHAFALGSANQFVTTSVLMKEMYWVYSEDSSAVSREDFLLVLAKLQTLLITASFYSDGQGTYLTSVGDAHVAEVGVMPSDDGRAYEVEKCNCGVGYDGLSCERCARGYHRVDVSSDKYLGKCQACNCNGHTEDCDPVTGQCLNCVHNTTGFHCEICLDGFYGNATDGTPNDCKECPCEKPRTTTALCVGGLDGRPKCLNCSEGYEGDICGSCERGFFGDPMSPGGNCSSCQCNNNSDVCDATTGRCLNCQYNTTGFHCERCENGTWGNATQQQCQACTCDETGAYHHVCNDVTGQCQCKPYVTGMNCSICEPYSYNFTSSGCTTCRCNTNGSLSLQCNESGICHCKNNTLGEKCDVCEWGFFGLPYAECQDCRCNETGAYNSSRCERTSGQCACKPGVTGRMCDRCMVQHTNFSGNGCDPCPLCSRLGLQGSINTTVAMLERAHTDADTVSNLKQLWPKLQEVEQLIHKATDASREFHEIVDGLSNNITQLMDSDFNRTISNLQIMIKNTSLENDNLRDLVLNQLRRIQELYYNTEAAKDNVTELNSTVSRILSALTNLRDYANRSLAGIDAGGMFKMYDGELELVDQTLQNVHTAYTFAMSARYNVTSQKNKSVELNDTVMGIDSGLNEAQSKSNQTERGIQEVTEFITYALALINQTKNLIRQTGNKVRQSEELLQTINGILNDSMQDINMAQSDYQEADSLVGGLMNDLDSLNTSLTTMVPKLSAANHSVIKNATGHAANLTDEARKIQSEFNRTLSHGARAVNAIETFKEVVRLASQSLETSQQINQDLQQIESRLENLTSISSELRMEMYSSEDRSMKLLEETKARDTNLTELRADVSLANGIFNVAVETGVSVDRLYSTIQHEEGSLERKAKLVQSELASTDNTSEFSEKAGNLSEPVIEAVLERLAKVDILEKRLQSINNTVQEAAMFKSRAIANVQNARWSLANVSSNVKRADELKNATASLQEELRKNMSALEDKLKRAREHVAKIRLALNVQGSTAVQYSPTARVTNTTRYTEISVDFNATRVRGSLFYLSDGKSNDAQSVALTLESGSFVKFQYDLGTGPIEITNWAVRVRPGHWYTAYATRYERQGRLTVTDHSMNFSRTYEANSSIMIDRHSTDFDAGDYIYVAGLPDDVMVNKTDRYFSGCIDNVMVNQESLNLWNPVKVDGNRSFCSRRPPTQLDVISGTSFFGIPEGHVRQKIGGFNITGESEIEFIFRTFLRSAFITSVLNGQNYVYGVYLNESKVMFYFKTSNNTYTVQSNLNTYSDGRWYRVHVVRGLRNASLTVRPVGPSDSGAVDYNMINTSEPVYLPVGQALFFGGKDPNSAINAPVNFAFAGVIRMINISGSAPGALMARPLNSANYTESFSGVKFAQVLPRVEQGIRFLGQSYAEVETGQQNITSLFLRFKTLYPSGVLLYSGEGPFFYMALFHGNLYVLYSSNLMTSFVPIVSSEETLNDGAYHYVTIEFGIDLPSPRVYLDGFALTIPEGFPSGPMFLSSNLWIGGVDESVIIPRAFPVIRSFKGDMKDIRLNDKAVNIFSGRSRYVSLAGVPPERSVVPTDKPTTPPPTLPPPTCGVPYPSLQNRTSEDTARLQGSEYIAFNVTREVLDYTKERFVISVTFRSLVPNGVLLYAADNVHAPNHFISLELVNGRLVFKQNSGAGTVRVASKFSNYSDGGIEYKCDLLRIYQFSAMLVSNKDYSNARVGDENTDLVINSPFFYGGVPPGINMSALESKAAGFIGCLGLLQIQNADSHTKIFNPRMDRDAYTSSYSYKPCYREVQSQAGFGGDGYIIYDTSYSMPDKTNIELIFRTTTRSGLLLYIAEGQVSMLLEQHYGQITLNVSVEENSRVVSWTDPGIPVDGQKNASFYLCDNKFHKIILRRNFSHFEFQVDDHLPVEASLPSGFTLQHGTFYIGGLPGESGSDAHIGLVGCVQTLRFDGLSVGIIRSPRLHNVQLGCNAPLTL